MKQHDDYLLGRHHYWTHFVCGFVFGGGLGCACPAKMNQHLVYQRIDLDLFVKGVTTRGKFVERGDGHYYRVLAECVL